MKISEVLKKAFKSFISSIPKERLEEADELIANTTKETIDNVVSKVSDNLNTDLAGLQDKVISKKE